MSFSRKLLKSSCKIGPLIISVAEPEQANHMIDAGLIYGYELYNCELYDGNCVVTQCFQCYLYRHEAGKCRNTRRCGFCRALGHATNECIGKDDARSYKCVPCRGRHKSWSRDCLVHKKHVEAAQAAYNQRPARYQTCGPGPALRVARPTRQREPVVQVPSTQDAVSTLAFSFADTSSTFTASNGWKTVQGKRNQSCEPSVNGVAKPVQKKGRPLGSTRASQNTLHLSQYSIGPTQTQD